MKRKWVCWSIWK